jgi:hypothetical protein
MISVQIYQLDLFDFFIRSVGQVSEALTRPAADALLHPALELDGPEGAVSLSALRRASSQPHPCREDDR